MGQRGYGVDRTKTKTLTIRVVVKVFGRLVRKEVVYFRHLIPRSAKGDCPSVKTHCLFTQQ